MRNFIFISPTFPKTYYQFPKSWKQLGGNALCIGDTPYDYLTSEMREAMSDYYQVSSLSNQEEMYAAVAWYAHKYGKPEWIESNNEFWLEQDAWLRTEFHIQTGDSQESVMRFKLKSNMKEFYKKAHVPCARYHLVTTLDEGLAFIQEVNYPVIVKPDDGVGSNATWKISNEEELRNFYNQELHTQYIMEEFVEGTIESYDGIVDQDGNIIFETAHIFPEPIMNIVNEEKECYFYSLRNIPNDLQQYGRAVIKEFGLKARFFHTEYFRLTKDKEGLGHKGDLVGLEVNMRPPGGYTTDMMNYANNINIYLIYAQMCMYQEVVYETTRPYYCCHCGRRLNLHYKHSPADIYRKYGQHLCMNERMPSILGSAMGDDAFIARFETKEELQAFHDFVFEKETPCKKK